MNVCRSLGCTLAVVFMTAACSHNEGQPPAGDGILVLAGDSALTEGYVLSRIPPGLDAEDSAALFRSIADRWIETQVLMQTASDYLADAEEIERKVQAYRRQLVMGSYLQRIRSSGRKPVSERRIKDYFSQYGDSMLLERPVVRGILVKADADSPSLDSIRSWMQATSRRTDRTDMPQGLRQAAQYDDFTDSWVDWDELARQIPCRLYDPAAFMAAGPWFETEAGGWVYMLLLTDVTEAGQPMPYEFARHQIAKALEQEEMHRAERQTVQRLINRAMDQGRLRAVGYDPATGRRSGS